MFKLFRYYNQNRKQIFVMILIIGFIFFTIQILNFVAKQQNEKDRKENIQTKETTYDNVVSYDKESKSIISENNIPLKDKKEFGRLIDEFYNYCINHNPEKAYELLSNDIKNNMYESEKIFESLYYSERFNGNKSFSFQSWINSSNRYTYQVKIYEDILSTGKVEDFYIEDYITVVNEDGKYVLNINGYIGKEQINVSNEKNDIAIKILNRYMYTNYEIYEILVKNNSNNNILLNNKNVNGSIFIMDNLENRFNALINENSDDDFLINSNEKKNIKLKFNIVQRDDMKIKSINFKNIILDYDNNHNEEIQNEMQIQLY